ncbi:MerR family transcriptional regulator [Aquabacterium parvum]|uniref:hypothetical protein n=1 Tax=Aquabacterium parvum TaxID=70584 RepID=UPI00128F2B89|nr:hypothetical protein [Aquabacterium parvum]MBU0915576.1 AlpA family transcriptional regulator [Gammaproteobacteria bacterium]
MENNKEQQDVVILRRPLVEKRTGLTKSGIYFLIREGSHSTAQALHAVRNYIDQLAAHPREPSAEVH